MKGREKQLTPKDRRCSFVRYTGGNSIHPQTKLRLCGLMMQAQHGDCMEKEIKGGGWKVGAKPSRTGTSTAVRSLKIKAWRAVKGTNRRNAMEEYVAILNELKPEWKIANLLGARDNRLRSEKTLAWVLKIDFDGTVGSDGGFRTAATSSRSLWSRLITPLLALSPIQSSAQPLSVSSKQAMVRAPGFGPPGSQ